MIQKKYYPVIFSLLALLGLCGCGSPQNSQYTYKTLVWRDEFKGSTLDETKWAAQLGIGESEGLVNWGNNEKQFYQKENALVQDGNLVIRVKKEDANGMEYTSARITTSDLFSFTYGRVEARIKLPATVGGIWSAFWLLPTGARDEWKYGNWAASGEIDVLEAKSRLQDEVSAAAHFGGEGNRAITQMQTYHFPEGKTTADWNIYALEWTPDFLVWYVNGEEFFRMASDEWFTIDKDENVSTPAPFDEQQAFCIILNAAVGGNFDGGIVPDESFSQCEMLVDWVRVYN